MPRHQLAQQLTIPIFAVASEQVFSFSGILLDEQRARLIDDILEALMHIND